MARITIGSSAANVVSASAGRDAIELSNQSAFMMFVRHGGTVDTGSDSNCGIPLPPGASRAVSGAAAKLPVSAVMAPGSPPSVLHYVEY